MPKTNKRLVCFPVDGSDNSVLAFQWFMDNMFNKENDFLFFLHAVAPAKLPTFSFKTGMKLPVENWEKTISKHIQDAKTVENKYIQLCESKGLIGKFEFHLINCDNNISEAILESIIELKVNIIVIASRGQSKLRRTFIGSVTEYLLRESDIPITIVKMNKNK